MGLRPPGRSGSPLPQDDPRDGEARDTRPAILLLTVGLGVAAAVAARAASTAAGAPALPGTAVLLLLGVYLLVATALHVEMRSGSHRDFIDLTEAALAPALVLLPGAVLVPLVAAVKLTVQPAQGLSAMKASFNAAQWAASVGAGSLVLAALRPPGPFEAGQLGALALALLVTATVNTVATVTVFALARGRSLRGLLSEESAAWGRASALGLGVAFALGLPLVALWQWAPAATPLGLAAFVGMHLGSRALATEQAGRSRLLGLQRAHFLLAGAVDPRPALPEFLLELRRAFEREDAALYALGAEEAPTTVLRPLDRPEGGRAEAAEARLVQTLVAAGQPTALSGRSGGRETGLLDALRWRDCLAAPVPRGDDVVGLLLVRDRQGFQGFEYGELAVLEAAATLLGEALHRGELAEALLAEREALRHSESRWRAIVNDAPDLLLVTDADGRIVYASPSAARLTGVAEDALIGTGLPDLLSAEEAPAVERLVGEVAAEAGSRRDGVWRLRASGGARLLEVTLRNLLDVSPVGGLVVNARDVTERRRAESLQAGQALVLERVARGGDLAETLGLLVKVVESQHDGVHCGVALALPCLDGPPRLVAEPHLEPAALGELLALLADLLPRVEPDGPPSVLDLGPPDAAAPPHEAVARPALLAAGVRVVAVHALPTDDAPAGGAVAALVLCHPGSDSERDLRLVAEAAVRLADITLASERARDRLAHQAAHDALTDLPNRAVFLDRLAHALDETLRTRRWALVLFLDLDRFKVVNDSLGHQAGDALLRAVAERLRRTVRPGDTVARFGGDEFTMLCEDIRDEAHALELVDRVREALRQPVTLPSPDGLGEHELFVTTSIGLALGRAPDSTPELLLENADAAMYRAKERGGTSYEVFDEQMRRRAHRRLGLQNAMHRAIETAQFRVVYQPTVSLRDGRVLGVEALVRWQHPEEGLLGPSEFIPLAEETGLIVPIGARVLTEAVRQAGCWAAAGSAVAVSVNLSAAQLKDPDLLATVREALAGSGVAPGQVTLELTESTLMEDVEASSGVLCALKDLGLRLVVDDFGTGWSSLTYLQRFPVDGLKVDRAFVAGLGRSEGDSAIVRSVLGLARSLDLVAVAEGVESREQVRHLIDLDCDVAQGYLFGRPLPPAEVDLLPRAVPSGLTGRPGGGIPGDQGGQDGAARDRSRRPVRSTRGATVAVCEVCGNDYRLSFEVHTAGAVHVFDSFECAVHRLAPVCENCGVKVVGHGVEADGVFFCCASCARSSGPSSAQELVDSAGRAPGD